MNRTKPGEEAAQHKIRFWVEEMGVSSAPTDLIINVTDRRKDGHLYGV